MLIGCCTNMLPKEPDEVGYQYAEAIQRAGYDYVELPLGQVNLMQEAEFAEMKRYLAKLGLPVYACNNFLTKDIKLVGEGIDHRRVEAFYVQALARAADLGSKYVVLGSPWSKYCPEGFSREKAFEQLTEWCGKIGDEAGKYGITIALEPNNHEETNMINTFMDTVKLAKAVSHENVRCLQDYFHLRMEDDTVKSVLEYGKELLVHTHFSRFYKRGFPKSMDEDAYYKEYFRALDQIGYQGGISMEGYPESKETFEGEACVTCDFLKKLATN